MKLFPRQAEGLDQQTKDLFERVTAAFKDTLGIEIRPVQLQAAELLLDRVALEMETGEGKTFLAPYVAAYHAPQGQVHIMTANLYLAERDAKWMRPVYEKLGLSVSFLGEDDCYSSDVVYGTLDGFAQDYIRDHLTLDPDAIKQKRDWYFALADEGDMVLIDNARQPVVVSAATEPNVPLLQFLAKIAGEMIVEEDYDLDTVVRRAYLHESGAHKLEQALGIDDLYQDKYTSLLNDMQQALAAKDIYTRDKEYYVEDGQIVRIHELTGRPLRGNRLNNGMHQALEAKEGLEIGVDFMTLGRIGYRSYMSLYPEIAAMSGTLKTSEKELWDVYRLVVKRVEPHVPSSREDIPDIVFATREEKFAALTKRIKENTARPVIVTATTAEGSLAVSEILTTAGIKHSLLNVYNEREEAEIIAGAGRAGEVTVITNMSGRGTDIVLDDDARQAGGILLLGSDRSSLRRYDDQLIGRVARNGDPGTTQFYLSAEDTIMQMAGGKRLAKVMLRFKMEEGVAHPKMSKYISQTQEKLAHGDFSRRRIEHKFDDVLNAQRKQIFGWIEELQAGTMRVPFSDWAQTEMQRLVEMCTDGYAVDLEIFKARLNAFYPYDQAPEDQWEDDDPTAVQEHYAQQISEYYADKPGHDTYMKDVERQVLFRFIIQGWIEHIRTLEILQPSMGLRTLVRRDPLAEYTVESDRLYRAMMEHVRQETLYYLMRCQVELTEDARV